MNDSTKDYLCIAAVVVLAALQVFIADVITGLL